MQSHLLLFSVLFFCAPSFSKAQERAKIQFQEYSTGVGSFYQTIPVEQQPMEGEIYIYPEFMPSLIQLEDSTEIVDAPLRYNVLKQRVEILKDDKVFEVDDQRIVSFTPKEGELGKFMNIINSPAFQGAGMDGFVEVLHDSPEIKLYRRHEVEILKANYNIALSTGNKNDEAKLKTKYVIFYNNRLQEFSGKAKEFAAVFGENRGSVQQFAKREKLKFRQEGDYIRLVEFIQENL